MGCAQSIETDQGQRMPIKLREPEPQVRCSTSQPTIDVQSNEKLINYSAQIKEIKSQILAFPENKKLFRNNVWQHIFGKFEKLYLKANQKVEFIDFLANLLEANFFQTQIGNQLTFCGQVGESFMSLQNRIYFKHKYCLQNFFFAIKPENKEKSFANHFGALSLDLSDEEVQKLSGKVRNLCQNDLNSFSFITLYLIHAIKKFIESNKSFQEVQKLLESVLLKLQKLYPASTNSTDVEEEVTFKNLKKVKLIVNYDLIKFVKGPKSNYDQLKDFVIQKAKGANDDKDLFFDLVHKICTKKGYGFRHGLKIKNENHEAAIFRTIEKVLDEEKYEQAFLAQKKKFLNSSLQYKNKNQINKMLEFVQTEKSQVKKLIVDILQKQEQIHFDAKDLLRAKCLYSKPNELIDTVEELLQSFSNKNVSLVLFKNRLKKKTKDLTLIINLPHSIAQLQLALKFDTTSNQFNHKIYELLRSRIYTPLTNLYVQNETWSSAFFADQFEIFHEIVKNGGMENFDEEITFKEIENEVIEFKQKFLTNEFLSIAIDSQQNNIKTVSQTLVNPLKNLKEIISHGYKAEKQPINRQQKQILNEIAFYQKSNNYEQAEQLLGQIQNMDHFYQNDPMIIRLNADLFYEKKNHASALEFYKKLIENQKKNNISETVEFADDEKQAGLCCKHLGYFKDALDYLNDALKLSKKLLGKQTFEYSNILQALGMVYDDQKNYPLALETYAQCLKIKEQVCGKETIEVANVIHNMGLIYSTTGKYDESADCFEKCLKIQEYIKGKQSTQCAITLGNMGVLYDSMKQPQKALEMHQRSLAIKQKIFGRQSIDSAIALNNIGMVYQSQQNYDKALGYYMESMAIKEKIKGKEDIDCAYCYLNVAILYNSMERCTVGIPYAERSYEIRRKVLGEEHPDTVLSLDWINYLKSRLQNQEQKN